MSKLRKKRINQSNKERQESNMKIFWQLSIFIRSNFLKHHILQIKWQTFIVINVSVRHFNCNQTQKYPFRNEVYFKIIIVWFLKLSNMFFQIMVTLRDLHCTGPCTLAKIGHKITERCNFLGQKITSLADFGNRKFYIHCRLAQRQWDA